MSSTQASERKRENLACDVKRKSARGQTPRLKVAMLTPGMDCSVVALKRGNARGARGTGHPLHDPLMVANRIWDEPWGCGGRRQPSMGGTSRMTGDRLVRICEGSRVKFLRSTRRLEQRGRVRRLHERNNWKQEDLDACNKQTVPYREAMGVRSVSSDQIQRRGGWGGWSDARAVRGRLVEKSLQDLESNEFGYLLSSASARRPHSEKEWRRKDPGSADGDFIMHV